MDPKLLALAEQLQAKVPEDKIEALIKPYQKKTKVYQDGQGQAFTWGPQGLMAVKAPAGVRYKAPAEPARESWEPLDGSDQERLAEMEARVDELAEECDDLRERLAKVEAALSALEAAPVEAKAAGALMPVQPKKPAAPEVPATKGRHRVFTSVFDAFTVGDMGIPN